LVRQISALDIEFMGSVGITWACVAAIWTAGALPAYRIEMAPAQRVEATLSFEIHTPDLAAEEWEVFVAKLPELPGQSKVSTKLEPRGKEIKEEGPLHRPLLSARYRAETKELKQGMKAQIKYEALLKSRRLVLTPAAAGVPGVRALTKEERQAALGTSAHYDFQAKRFQDWLDGQSLRRHKDEDAVAFARRVFQDLAENYTYLYRSEMDREASKVCKAEGSDCGGLSILFVSTLRANGIPARILVGRWAKSADKGEKLGGVPYLQTHVKAEFYAERVGWVPVDVSLAVKQKTGKLWYFGRDEGDFLVFHIDPELAFTTTHFGKKTEPFLQGVAYWVTGSGSLTKTTTHEDWQVRKRSIQR
jgi:hypothetical protein